MNSNQTITSSNLVMNISNQPIILRTSSASSSGSSTHKRANAWWCIPTRPNQKKIKHTFHFPYIISNPNKMNKTWEGGERKPVHPKKWQNARSNLTKISPEKTCLLPNIEETIMTNNILLNHNLKSPRLRSSSPPVSEDCDVFPCFFHPQKRSAT